MAQTPLVQAANEFFEDSEEAFGEGSVVSLPRGQRNPLAGPKKNSLQMVGSEGMISWFNNRFDEGSENAENLAMCVRQGSQQSDFSLRHRYSHLHTWPFACMMGFWYK
jgi:hypothetical protein